MDPQILAITDYQGNELKENDVKERLQALKVRIKGNRSLFVLLNNRFLYFCIFL